MFIVEGPDGAGKTTLIRRLQEQLGFEVMPRPCTSDNGIDMTTLRQWVDEDLSRPLHYHGFYDRYPLISEPIYGPLLRGRMADGFSDFHWMSDRLTMLTLRQPLIVFCLPPKQRVMDNVLDTHSQDDTEHLRGVIQHTEAIYEAYTFRAAAQSIMGDIWVWDYTKEDADMDFLHLTELVKEKMK